MESKERVFTRLNQEFGKIFLNKVQEDSRLLIVVEKENEDAVKAAIALTLILRAKTKRVATNVFIETTRHLEWAYLKQLSGVIMGQSNEDYARNFKNVCILHTTSSQVPCISLKQIREDGTHEVLEMRDAQCESFVEMEYLCFSNYCLLKNTDARALLYEATGDQSHLLRFNESPLHISVLIEEIFDLLPRTPEKFLSLRKQLSHREIQIASECLSRAEHHSFAHWPRLTSFFLPRLSLQKFPDSEIEIEQAIEFTLQHFGTLTYGSSWGVILFPKENGNVQIRINAENEKVHANRILESLNIGTGSRKTAFGIFARELRQLEPELCLRELLHHLHGNAYNPIIDKLVEAPYEVEIRP